MSPHHVLAAAALALALALGDAAAAQVVNAPPAWTSGGYNGAYAATSQAYEGGVASTNGDTILVNGELQSANAVSIASQFSTLGGGAGAGGGVGAGYSTATAVGNLLNIQVTGSGDTVIVNANQTNSGTLVASTPH